MIRQYALSIFLLLAALENVSAFTPATSTRSLASVSPIVPQPLYMSEEPEASAEEPAAEEPVEEVPEDPEVTALKQEIANLESDLTKLGLDRVDLVILHFPPFPSFVARSCTEVTGCCAMARAQWKAMEEFYYEGKV